MFRFIRVLSIMLALQSVNVGCGLMQTTKEASRETMKMFRPKSDDYRDSTGDPDDDWANLGETARTMRPRERTADPLRKYLLSPKAQSIERDLGIE